MKQATIILAFYNDFTLLRLVLKALEAQYEGQFEVLIADDGSDEPTVRQVKSVIRSYPFKINHIWHPNQGFGKAIILNKATLRANTEHLIFMDADCVPQQGFVNDHLRGLRSGVCQAGRRVDVFYDALTSMDETSPELFFRKYWIKFLAWSMSSRARNIERGIRIPTAWINRNKPNPSSLVGCNFSIFRQDLLAINGFDERANVPWGAEDSDLERRLKKKGVLIEGLKHQAVVIHFDRSYDKRGINKPDDSARVKIFEAAKLEDSVWTSHGIIKADD